MTPGGLGIWREAAGAGGKRAGIGDVLPAVIGHEELRTLTGPGAQLVEVLPADEYAWAHLPSAAPLLAVALARRLSLEDSACHRGARRRRRAWT